MFVRMKMYSFIYIRIWKSPIIIYTSIIYNILTDFNQILVGTTSLRKYICYVINKEKIMNNELCQIENLANLIQTVHFSFLISQSFSIVLLKHRLRLYTYCRVCLFHYSYVIQFISQQPHWDSNPDHPRQKGITVLETGALPLCNRAVQQEFHLLKKLKSFIQFHQLFYFTL